MQLKRQLGSEEKTKDDRTLQTMSDTITVRYIMHQLVTLQ